MLLLPPKELAPNIKSRTSVRTQGVRAELESLMRRVGLSMQGVDPEPWEP